MLSSPYVLLWAIFCPSSLSGYLLMSGDNGCHIWELILTSSGRRSEMLLSTLWCTGQPSAIKNNLAQ
jgi:hypothetical protein